MWGLGSRTSGLRLKVSGSGLRWRIEGLVCRVLGVGSRCLV